MYPSKSLLSPPLLTSETRTPTPSTHTNKQPLILSPLPADAIKRALGEELLLTVFRVTADRGWMQVHLFKSSNNTLLAEMPNGGHHRSERGQADHRFNMSSKFVEESKACDEVSNMIVAWWTCKHPWHSWVDLHKLMLPSLYIVQISHA